MPLHLQIRHQIIQDISSGRALPGTQLPSVREAADYLGVTAGTVQKAYRDLRAGGVIQPRERRGNYVSDYTPPISPRRDEPLVERLVRSLVEQVKTLGYGVPDVRQALDALDATTTGRRPNVCFVARTPPIEAEHVPLLEANIGDIADVRGISFGAIRDISESATAQSDCDLLVTLIPSMSDLRRAASTLNAPAMGLVIELRPETQEALLAIPRGASVAVVAERPFIDATLRVVHEHLGVEASLHAVDVGSKRLKTEVAQCDFACASATAYPVVRQLSGDSARLIELRYQPTQAALNRLRSIVTDLGAPASD